MYMASILSHSDTDSEAAFGEGGMLLPAPASRPTSLPLSQSSVTQLTRVDLLAESSIVDTLKITGLRKDEVKNIVGHSLLISLFYTTLFPLYLME